MKRTKISLLSLLSFSLFLPPFVDAQERTAPAAAQQSDLAARLRLRCEGLYTAIQNSQWRKVESFFNEDAKVAWAAIKKSAIYGFEIQSVSVAPNGKTGVTETAVDSPMRIPGFPGTKIRTQQKVEWAWENDDWYALLKDLPDRDALPEVGADGTPPRAQTPPENLIPSELQFTSQVYDFKLIRRGDAIHAKFYFTNKSNHLVKAKADISNPCRCVTARLSKDEFKPGEEGWVEATMDTKEFGGYLRQALEVNVQPSGAKVLLVMHGSVLLPWQNRDQK